MAEKEEWREVEGYEDYEVSNFGNVRSFISNKILNAAVGNHGYKSLCLRKDNKAKRFLIHRLVAEAFCENPENKSYVDHINNNKLDNHYKNLRFCSGTENNYNKRLQSNNTSGCTGVTFYKKYNKWQVRLKTGYKTIHVGYFETLEEAKAARLKKEKEICGEFSPNK